MIFKCFPLYDSKFMNCNHLYTVDFDTVDNCSLWLEGLLMVNNPVKNYVEDYR